MAVAMAIATSLQLKYSFVPSPWSQFWSQLPSKNHPCPHPRPAFTSKIPIHVPGPRPSFTPSPIDLRDLGVKLELELLRDVATSFSGSWEAFTPLYAGGDFILVGSASYSMHIYY